MKTNEMELTGRSYDSDSSDGVAVQAVQAADEPAELTGNVVKIQDIVKNESAYDGKDVVIQGKIDTGMRLRLLVHSERWQRKPVRKYPAKQLRHSPEERLSMPRSTAK